MACVASKNNFVFTLKHIFSDNNSIAESVSRFVEERFQSPALHAKNVSKDVGKNGQNFWKLKNLF